MLIWSLVRHVNKSFVSEKFASNFLKNNIKNSYNYRKNISIEIFFEKKIIQVKSRFVSLGAFLETSGRILIDIEFFYDLFTIFLKFFSRYISGVFLSSFFWEFPIFFQESSLEDFRDTFKCSYQEFSRDFDKTSSVFFLSIYFS